MKDLREEAGTNDCIFGKIYTSRLKWTGHMVIMKYKRLPQISETMKQGGCKKRGRI